MKQAEALAGWLMAGPALVAVVVFLYGPMAAALGLSVTDVPLLGGAWHFAGLSNYRDLLADRDFRMAAANTGWYVALLVPMEIVLPLGLALLLRDAAGSRLSPVWRGALFLPTVLAYSVSGVVWSWMLNPLVGAVNEALAALGLGRSRWHTDPDLALLCVALVTFWKTFGLNMMLWLAALLGLPQELRDAAALDGAGFWARLLRIELPLVSPTGFFIALTTLFVVLDDMVGVIDPLTGGGPAGRSSNLLFDMWRRGMGYFLFGQATASSVLIILAVVAVSALQFRLMGRRVVYG